MNKNRSYFATTTNEAFLEILKDAYENPDFIVSPRGEDTREIICTHVTISDPSQRIITNKYRGFSLRYGIAEWLWYERGSNSLEEISFYSKFWKKVSDDGKTVNSAYGYRIFGNNTEHSVNQWDFVIKELVIDKESRRAVIMLISPRDMLKPTKDFLCTAFLQFFIRNERLYLSVNMRSNDLILGFANDVFAFTLFQEKMLIELRAHYPQLQLGMYHHFSTSSHIYKRNFEMVESIIRSPNENKIITMPPIDDLSEIDQLQLNESIIRNNTNKDLFPLKSNFCNFCQNTLIGKKES
ncbi:MAG: thymidylate synthase [Candidatus Woesebacteria bacterium]